MDDAKNLKIVLYGSAGVGKTCLFQRFCGKEIEKTVCSIGVEYYSKMMEFSGQKVKLGIFDTCGEEKVDSIMPIYFRNAVGIILVYDVTERKTFKKIHHYNALYNKESSVTIIAANKVDREPREVSEKEGMELADSISALYIECSAKTEKNVNEILEKLVKKILENPDLIQKKSSNRLKIDEIQTTKDSKWCSVTGLCRL